MSEPTSASPAPRIAIRFGAPSSSSKPPNGSKRPAQSQPPSTLGKRPRPHALNQDSDSDDDDSSHGRHEVVTSFGDKGAVNDVKRREAKAARDAQKPLTIACQANRDWKAETRAQRGELLPHERENRFKGQNQETEPADQDKGIKWGLTVTKKASGDEQPITEANDESPTDQEGDRRAEPAAQQHAQNVDQDAIDALLGKDNGQKRKLVISEDDALKRDYSAVGEVSTLEEYDQIPDGEFGLAMLRGMGYDGKSQGTKPKEVRRRPALLGLGAKEDEEIKKAELAKKYGHRERRPRLDEYRRDKEKERQQREERHSSSYKKHGHAGPKALPSARSPAALPSMRDTVIRQSVIPVYGGKLSRIRFKM
ncbi:hypothetical protein JX266_000666 [Neoarthrinium moseri]|nr:hypothetical protein JX266_000666 [Neoarthrinium moseri]